MSGASLPAWIPIAWGAVTLVFLALLSYRFLIGREEEDQLFLDPAESKLEQKKTQIITRLNRVAPYTKGFGFASMALLLVMFGFWAYGSYKAFTNPTMP